MGGNGVLFAASLYQNGQPVASFTGLQIRIFDNTYLTFDTDSNNQPGNYSLQLTNPGGMQSNLYTFTVYPQTP